MTHYKPKARDSDLRMTALATDTSSRQRGSYIRTMTARVQLKKSLVVILKGLGVKTN
jgi:hypothetical protein